MLILKIFGLILLAYLLILWLVPKGNFIYEAIWLPVWLVRLKLLPSGNFIETKYAYGKHFRQYLLFFRPKPAGTKERKAAVVYIHGGGWQYGRPEMFRPNAQLLVNEGYAVFLLSHRRIPFYNCGHILQDMAFAMAKVYEIMVSQGCQNTKIILGGTSSGGNLAALMCYDRSVLETSAMPPGQIHALFLLGVPLNLNGMWRSPPLFLFAGKRAGSLFKKADPMFHLQPGGHLPTLIVHGEKDGLVEYESVVAFYEKLKSCHRGGLRFFKLPNGVHTDAASWAFPGHPCREILLDWLRDVEPSNIVSGL